MKCRQVEYRLDELDWKIELIRQDSELSDHLEKCPACRSLLEAQTLLDADLARVREVSAAQSINLHEVRADIEAKSRRASYEDQQESVLARLAGVIFGNIRRTVGFATLAVIVAFLAFVPLTFEEKVGYQIAIDGIEKDVAVSNQQITGLLGALGMGRDEALRLIDSLGVDQVTFSIGECSETCKLTISDLRTERDVRLMVQAIIDLGCCRINGIIPVFRNESTSILEYAARKLLS